MKKITVEVYNKTYPVFIGSSIFNRLPSEIKRRKLYTNLFVIIDENVNKYHGGKIIRGIKNAFPKVNFYFLKPGERSKSGNELNRIYAELIKKNYGRDTLIVGIGGGVTGDLAGYAASTFMRGVQLVHVPTTILANVDSSVGGKTGINFQNKKNLIGSFYQPEFVFIDLEFIASLPVSEMNSGLGEIIKYAFLTNKKFFGFVFNNLEGYNRKNETVIRNLLNESVSFKASVVAKDEKESGLRKILNLGHTFAHSYESELKFKIKHGEAVIAGVISAIFLSNNIGILSKQKKDLYLDMLSKITLPAIFSKMNNERLYEIMGHDKKNRNQKVRFVLLSDIGNLLTDVEVDKKRVIMAIESTKKFLKQ